MPADKPIVITITVLPFNKGKRRLIVSGAPQGEMPVVHTGEFAQVHQLINAAWAELVRRKPQVPKVKASPAAASPAAASPTPTAAQGDQLVASGTSPGGAVMRADLPVIEDAAPDGDAPGDAPGDQLVASPQGDAPAGDAPALTSLDETEEAEEDTND